MSVIAYNRGNLIGQIFGRLTVIEFAYTKNSAAYWLCKCTCGNQKLAKTAALKIGDIVSCGCYNKEASAARAFKHGQAVDGKHSPEYDAWVAIKTRCYCINNKSYKNYGGRGIKVCERWLNSFDDFFNDMGIKPSRKHSIDRIDVNGNYEPSNCRWATKHEQDRNKRTNIWIEFNGIRKIQKDWAKELGISQDVLSRKLKNKQYSGMRQVFLP